MMDECERIEICSQLTQSTVTLALQLRKWFCFKHSNSDKSF